MVWPFHCCSLSSVLQRVRAQATCSVAAPQNLNPSQKGLWQLRLSPWAGTGMLRWLGCAKQGQTCISPGQGTGEAAASALSHVSQLMVVACQGQVASFPLMLLQCRMGYNKIKTCSFISPILQPFLQHAGLHLALSLDCSRVKAHLLSLQLSHCAKGSSARLSPNTSVLAGARAPLLG